MINWPINHNLAYKDLHNWLNSIYETNKQGFKLALRFGFVLYLLLQITFGCLVIILWFYDIIFLLVSFLLIVFMVMAFMKMGSR